jgi:type VI secretion system secreted protein VgrG
MARGPSIAFGIRRAGRRGDGSALLGVTNTVGPRQQHAGRERRRSRGWGAGTTPAPESAEEQRMDNARLSFEKADAGLTVRRFKIEEAMSGLFRVAVRAMSPDDSLDLSRFVGRRAELVLEGAVPRRFRGLCVEMALARVPTTDESLATYDLVLAPTLWRATQRRGQRLFQHVSIPDVVTRLLQEWGIVHAWRIDAPRYPKVELRAQYGETDFAFLSRLLEEAGIAFHFVDGAEDDADATLILDDAPERREARREALPFVDDPSGALAGRVEHVTKLVLREQSRHGAVTLRDFDPRRPRLELYRSAASDRPEEAAHEQYHHLPGAFLHEKGGPAAASVAAVASELLAAAPPGGSTPRLATAAAQALVTDTPVADDLGVARHDSHAGAALAQRMLEALHVDRRAVTFETSAHDLSPGVILAVTDHPRDDVSRDRRLLVTRHEIEGELASPEPWRFAVSAVFTDHPYRPPLVTPKPRIYGIQSAVVVGPDRGAGAAGAAWMAADAAALASKLPGAAGLAAGVAAEAAAAAAHLIDNEIYVDELGRVRVQFNWDREGRYDARSSIWMRVSQGWAGGGYGLFTIPRVGHEVLVAFLDGDPDCPIVVGSVHNQVEPVPFKLPENKTVSTWKTASSPGGAGFNELRFEDAAGREHLFLQAQKDMDHLVKQNLKQGVGGDSSRYTEGHDSVAVGADRTRFVNQSEVEVTGLHRSTFVGLNRVSTVGGEDSSLVGSRWSVSIGRGLTRRLTREIESAAKALGSTVRNTAGSVLGMIPGNPLASAADAALADFGRSAFDTLHGVLDVMKGFASDPGPPPTSIEMVDRQIKLSTGEASIILDGPNITIAAQGVVAIHAMDNISILAEREVVLAAREKAAVISGTDDVIVQAKNNVHLNPYEGGGLAQAEGMAGRVGRAREKPPGVCDLCGGELDESGGDRFCTHAAPDVEPIAAEKASEGMDDEDVAILAMWQEGLDLADVLEAMLPAMAEGQEETR